MSKKTETTTSANIATPPTGFSDVGNMNMYSKDQVSYKDISDTDLVCSGCSRFVSPNSCKIVVGSISASGYCNQHSKSGVNEMKSIKDLNNIKEQLSPEAYSKINSVLSNINESVNLAPYKFKKGDKDALTPEGKKQMAGETIKEMSDHFDEFSFELEQILKETRKRFKELVNKGDKIKWNEVYPDQYTDAINFIIDGAKYLKM